MKYAKEKPKSTVTLPERQTIELPKLIPPRHRRSLSSYSQVQVLGDEHSEDLNQVLHRANVDGTGVIGEFVPNVRKWTGNYMQDWNLSLKKRNMVVLNVGIV